MSSRKSRQRLSGIQRSELFCFWVPDSRCAPSGTTLIEEKHSWSRLGGRDDKIKKPWTIPFFSSSPLAETGEAMSRFTADRRFAADPCRAGSPRKRVWGPPAPRLRLASASSVPPRSGAVDSRGTGNPQGYKRINLVF